MAEETLIISIVAVALNFLTIVMLFLTLKSLKDLKKSIRAFRILTKRFPEQEIPAPKVKPKSKIDQALELLQAIREGEPQEPFEEEGEDET